MLPHAEDDATLPSDPHQLRLLVVPGISVRTDEVALAVDCLHELGLLTKGAGSHANRLQLRLDSFFKYQTYIPAEKRRETPNFAELYRGTPQNASSPSPSPSPSPLRGGEDKNPLPPSGVSPTGEQGVLVVEKLPSQTKAGLIPYDEIVAAYHEACPTLPKAKAVGPKSKVREHIRSRWADDPERHNLEWWREYFKSVAEMPFLMGKSQTRDGADPFRASLQWLVLPTNMEKVLNGNYKREEPVQKSGWCSVCGYDYCMCEDIAKQRAILDAERAEKEAAGE
jgi:hypothetical protein